MLFIYRTCFRLEIEALGEWNYFAKEDLTLATSENLAVWCKSMYQKHKEENLNQDLDRWFTLDTLLLLYHVVSTSNQEAFKSCGMDSLTKQSFLGLITMENIFPFYMKARTHSFQRHSLIKNLKLTSRRVIRSPDLYSSMNLSIYWYHKMSLSCPNVRDETAEPLKDLALSQNLNRKSKLMTCHLYQRRWNRKILMRAQWLSTRNLKL